MAQKIPFYTPINQVKDLIDFKTGKAVDIFPASDGANLLYEAKQNDVLIARIYKSWVTINACIQKVYRITYTWNE